MPGKPLHPLRAIPSPEVAALAAGVILTLFAVPSGEASQGVGATILRDGTNVAGVTFRVWAPNASAVAVRGDFNGWGETVMTREGGGGYWSGTAGSARAGDEYRYAIRWEGNSGGTDQLDPRSLQIRTNPGGVRNSVVYDHSEFDWEGHKVPPEIAPWDRVMYELHTGTFHDPDPLDGRPGTFDDAITRLPYLKRLGVNTIALMPVAEFSTPTSWGYNPQYPFAVEESYGGPDGLKRFVREAHRHGMTVQLDIVHNHYGGPVEGTDLIGFGGGNSYFYGTNTPIGRTAWGPRPNYGEAEVRSLITDSTMMFLREYGMAGLRWDSPRNIMGFDPGSTGFSDVGDPSQVIHDGKSLIAGINEAIHTDPSLTGRWSVSEDSDLLVPTNEGFYGDPFLQGLQVASADQSFDGHWQTSFHNTITPQIALERASATTINSKVSDWSEPPGWRVIFTDNHDKAGDLNIGAADGGNLLIGRRLANRMDPANQAATSAFNIPIPGGVTNPVTGKKVLLNAVLTLTAPGVPMLLMGQEFGASGSFGDTRRTDWREASRQSGVWRAHRDLIRLRTSLPGLRNLELGAGSSSQANGAVLTYRRTNGVTEADHVFVVLNFSPDVVSMPLTNLPSGGNWYQRLNTDWTIYGGGSTPLTNALGTASTLQIPAYSSVVLAKAPAEAGEFNEMRDGVAAGWLDLFGVTAAGDDDGDGLDSLREWQLGLDPREEDTARIHYGGRTRVMRAGGGNPVAQHVGYFTYGSSVPSPSSFTFLNDNIAGPYHASPAGTYGRFLLNLTNYASSHSYFFAETNLMVVDTNRTNWADYHRVQDFGGDLDGDSFTNLQEFARGSDPNRASRTVVTVAGGFNGWDLDSTPMRFAGGTAWSVGIAGRGGDTSEFKFTAGAWELGNWGDSSPIDGVGDPNGGNIPISFNRGNGIYGLSFDEESLVYGVTHDATDANVDGIQDAWVTHHGLTGGNAMAGSDPDGDGWSNLAEFARFTNANGTIMNPTVSDQSGAPKRMTVTGNTAPMPAWNPDARNMEWSDQRMRWEWVGSFSNTGDIQFKFSQATDPNSWTGGVSWGAGAEGVAQRYSPDNIVAGVSSGVRYRFSFNDLTGNYSITTFPPSAEWWEGEGLPGEGPVSALDARWGDDYDRDGFSQRMEYALGGNPRARDARGLISMWTTNSGGADRLVMRWAERTNVGTGLTVSAVLSTNLASTNWTLLTPTNAPGGGEVPLGHRMMEVSVPVNGGAKFLRLRVTGP
jgi:1,4-alpha-glucan branching enzyme